MEPRHVCFSQPSFGLSLNFKKLKKDFLITRLKEKAFIEDFFNSLSFQEKFLAGQKRIRVKKIKVFKEFSEHGRVISMAIAYDLIFGTKKAAIFGVAHADSLWEPVYARLKHVYDHGFSEGEVRTNNPIGYFPELKTLLYYRVPGIPLIQKMKKNTPDLEQVFYQTGQGLAKLHAVPARVAPVYSLKAERQDFEEYSLRVLTEFAPELKQEMEPLIKEMLMLLKKFFKHLTFTHGDFHPKNILVSGERVYIIDYTNACLFAAESDVGDFLAQISCGYFDFDQRKALGLKRIKKLQEQFLDGYFTKNKKDRYTLKAIAFFEVRTLIKIIIHIIHWGKYPEKQDRKLVLSHLALAKKIFEKRVV